MIITFRRYIVRPLGPQGATNGHYDGVFWIQETDDGGLDFNAYVLAVRAAYQRYFNLDGYAPGVAVLWTPETRDVDAADVPGLRRSSDGVHLVATPFSDP